TPTASSSPHFQYADANLIIRTSDHVELRVHKSIMASTSRVFKDMLSLDDLRAQSSSETRVVDVTETSAAMEAALRFLYPLPRPILTTLEPIVILLEIGDKYDIPILGEAMQEGLLASPFIQSHTTRVYSIS
ncbi:hypothetical protein SISNIDRAFT_391687, partial [Sistotremastrum niveocremeum HHB9708]